jgi:hypothetical protein
VKAHTEYEQLEELPDLVHKQRRLFAGLTRIKCEERALREQIDALLADAGADVVCCETTLGPFEIRRAIALDGHHYASISPLAKPAAPPAARPGR